MTELATSERTPDTEGASGLLAMHAAVRLHQLADGSWYAVNLDTRAELKTNALGAAIIIAYAGGAAPATALARLRRQFRVDAHAFEKGVETLRRHGLLVKPGDPSSELARRISDRWACHGWREAADYYLATHDYPFIDYSSRVSFEVDAARMRAYITEQPDLDRSKAYPPDDWTLPPTTATPDALQQLPSSLAAVLSGAPASAQLAREALETLMSVTFGQLRSRSSNAEGRAPSVRRTSPSGGSRHPAEGYLVTAGTPGLADGAYHFSTRGYHLQRLTGPVPIARLLDQPDDEDAATPSALILLTSMFERNMYRYREPRTFRTLLLDAGHLVATLDLTAAALGLQAVRRYDTRHDAVERLLGLDPLAEGSICGVLIKERQC